MKRLIKQGRMLYSKEAITKCVACNCEYGFIPSSDAKFTFEKEYGALCITNCPDCDCINKMSATQLDTQYK